MVALVLLSSVLASLAPTFYGEMAAAAATDYRSTATGLAVAAIEQLRALPYGDLGWDQSDYAPGGTAAVCVSPTNTYQSSGTAPAWNVSADERPVALTSGSVLDAGFNLAAQETIGAITYDITRCVYWVGSSSGVADAYKQTWVGVSWQIGSEPWHISQWSAIYPPDPNSATSSSCQNGALPPAPPAALQATLDSTNPTGTIDLTWSEGTDSPSALPVTYQVDYSSNSSAGPWTLYSRNSLPYQHVDQLSAGTHYWFEVWTVACDGTRSLTAATTNGTTQSAPSACTASDLTVQPAMTTIGSNDKLDKISAFQVSSTVSAACTDVAVHYSPQNNGSVVSDPAPAGGGTLSWPTSASKWATGTIRFYLFINGSQVGAPFEVQIACDAKKC